jgi:hypothetical protein
MYPARGVCEILPDPEKEYGGDNGELAGDNKEGVPPLAPLIEGLDLVGSEVALFGGKKGICHGSLSPESPRFGLRRHGLLAVSIQSHEGGEVLLPCG